MNGRRLLRLLFKLAVSAVLVALLLRKVDVRRLGAIIATLDLLPYLAAFSLVVTGTLASTLKWRLLLANLGLGRPFRELLGFYWIGSFSSMFLPSTVGGDVVRTALLGRENREPLRTASSVLAERLLGLLALLGIAFVSFLLNYGMYRGKAVEGLLWAAGAGFLGLALFFTFPRLLHLVTRPLLLLAGKRGWDRPAAFLRSTEEAVADVLGHKKNLLLSTGISLLFQLSLPLQTALIAHAMGLPIPWQYFFSITPIAVLLIAFPVSFNGIGVREWVAVVLYGSLGVAKEQALALSFMGFFLVLLNALIGGIILFFYRHGKKKTV